MQSRICPLLSPLYSLWLPTALQNAPSTFQKPSNYKASPRCLVGRVESEAWGLVTIEMKCHALSKCVAFFCGYGQKLAPAFTGEGQRRSRCRAWSECVAGFVDRALFSGASGERPATTGGSPPHTPSPTLFPIDTPAPIPVRLV